ncbi:putative WRKY transcription factor 19 [Vitis vinifera]|uniref:Putative WRKY transcription factor 19 n=1 Tax=Vitis vinifera TaxID=29760 RepID=A0A438DP47_VITVI|nr:putative WRKY transcription factor 19 [Vitis vinifera]
MDNISRHFTDNFTSASSKHPGIFGDPVASYPADTALRLDLPGVPYPYLLNSKGAKRKFDTIDGPRRLQDGSSLVFGLGHSSSSSDSKGSSATACTTISSMKETEDDFLMDLNLDFNLHIGKERTLNPKKNFHSTPKGLEVEKPKLDLVLSLSSGYAESDITSVTPDSGPFQSNVEMPVTPSTVELVDEGSTSLRWKRRHFLPPLHPLQNTDTAAGFIPCAVHTDPTPVTLSLPPTVIVMPESSVSSALETSNGQQQRSTSVKTCQVEGCWRGARGASGRCIAHGGGRRCHRIGCQKGAEGKTVFCKAHGGGRRCQHLGCTKSAEGRTELCIAHGGGKRCSSEGCIRAARGKSGLCIRHGGGKRCRMENCTRSAEGFSGLCISHGGGRRCQYPECTKGAQGSTMFCKAHGGGKRCTAPGCTKGAEGSTPFCKGHGGGKRCTFQGGCTKSVHGGTLFCVAHGGGKRCAIPECTKSARAGRLSVFVMVEGKGANLKGAERVHKAALIFARLMVGEDAALGVQDKRVHGGSTLDPTLQGPKPSMTGKMKNIVTSENVGAEVMTTVGSGGKLLGVNYFGSPGFGHSMQMPTQDNAGPVQISLPEGRVHGGSLMAMLRGGIGGVGAASSSNQAVCCPSVQGKSYTLPLGWMASSGNQSVGGPSGGGKSCPVPHGWITLG